VFNILCVHRMYPILLIIGSKLILTSKVNFELQKIVTHCKSFLLEFKIAKKCHQEKFHCILWYLLYISIFCLSKSPFSVFSPSSLCFWTSWPCSMFVATPLWGKCEDETHTPKSGNLKSSGTLKNLELDFKGQNTSHWGVLCTLERSWSVDVKNGLAWAIWTSTTQVMVERRARSQTAKLAIWLLTTKSQESNHSRFVHVECDTLLEISWRELQLCFRPHPNRRSELGVMSSQSPGSPNQDNFRDSSLAVPRQKAIRM
jgi:hypothetical protein